MTAYSLKPTIHATSATLIRHLSLALRTATDAQDLYSCPNEGRVSPTGPAASPNRAPERRRNHATLEA
jgi:hypothetical protein